jgi:pyrimidine operon attenuation protein/uracil phosphoribosyltransferase
MAMPDKIVMSESDIEKAISDLSKKVYADIDDIDKFAIIGIQSRGVDLAHRIKKQLEGMSETQIKLGILDITFYRDDLSSRGKLPAIKETQIDFDITEMTLLLVDDVLFTGRTIKAALETLTSFGRPKLIKLCTLVDRGNRELPIQADYCSKKIQTESNDRVSVRMIERDGENLVVCSSE